MQIGAGVSAKTDISSHKSKCARRNLAPVQFAWGFYDRFLCTATNSNLLTQKQSALGIIETEKAGKQLGERLKLQ